MRYAGNIAIAVLVLAIFGVLWLCGRVFFGRPGAT